MANAVGPHDADMVTTQALADMAREPYSTIDHWAAMSLLPFKRRGATRYFDPTLCLGLCRHIRDEQNRGKSLRVIREELGSR